MPSTPSTTDAVRLERATRLVAAAGAAVGVCALTAALVLMRPVWTIVLAIMLLMGGLIVVGTVIVVRRRNLVGWLCWLAGLLASLAIASAAYTEYALTLPDPLPGWVVVGWFSLWLGSPWVWVLFSIPLVFPDGHLPSPRWRPAVWAVAVVMISEAVLRALDPGVDPTGAMPYNPIGVEAAGRVHAVLESAWLVGTVIPVGVPLAALVVRFRRSVGVERLQLKWLVYAVSLVALLLAIDAARPNVLPVTSWDVIYGLGYGTLPIAIAVAVLRYRLYDIDRLIRRTLVYAVVSAILGVVYATGVLVVGAVFGGRQSDVVVAASTLAAAALFGPVRNRTQLAVDRHFYRQRFDAHRTVAAFNDMIREDPDTEVLIRQLLALTQEVVQPSSQWLWLAERPPPPARTAIT